MAPVYDFDPPARFVAGTVGPPGQRTFFLQARSGRRLISVSCEKEQLTIFADRILDVLDELQIGAEPTGEWAAALVDDAPLDTPIEDEFRVRVLSLAWDPQRLTLVLEARPDDDDDHDDDDDEGHGGVEHAPPSGDALRVTLTAEAARSFARRCQRVIASGRPPCPLCGLPLDVTGHVCPRANGYRR